MTAATMDRNTAIAHFGRIKGPYAMTSGLTVYAGTIAAVASATGLLATPGDTAGLVVVGIHAKKAIEANGDNAEVVNGAAWFVNDGTVTVANGVGRNATLLDDQTVSVAGTTTNDIVVGEIEAVDSTLGVLVAIGV